jgi:hypothetical protein
MSAVSSLAMLLIMDSIRIILLLGALVILIRLAARSKNIRSFQFQLSIFIAISIAGDMASILDGNGIILLLDVQNDAGSATHLVSLVFLA